MYQQTLARQNKYAVGPKQAADEEPRVNHRWFVLLLGLTPLLTISATFGGRAGLYSLLGFVPPLSFIVVPWILAVLIRNRTSWDLRIKRAFVIFLLLWVIGALVSVIQFPVGFKYTIGRFIFVLLIFMSYGSLASRVELRFFEKVYVTALLLLALLTILHAYGLVSLPVSGRVAGRKIFDFLPNRTQGIQMSAGEFAILLSFGFGLLIPRIFAFVSSKKQFRFDMIGFAILVFTLALIQSRSAFVGFFALLLTFSMTGLYFNILTRLGKFLTVLILIISVVILVTGRLSDISEWFMDINVSSATVRMDMNRYAIEIVKEYPFFGIGYGRFYFIYDLAKTSVDIHNAFLNELASVGVFYGSMYIFVWLVIIRSVVKTLFRRDLDNELRRWAFGLLCAFTMTVVALNLFGGFFVEVLAIMWAFALRLEQLAGQTQNTKNSAAAA